MKTVVRISLLSCFLGTGAFAHAEDNPLIDRLNELAAMPLDELKANIHEVMPIIKALNGATSEGNAGSEGYAVAKAQSPETQAAITNFNVSVKQKLQAPVPQARVG
ncbi:MAG: hypothetical protein LLF94_04230, partial [Chlamydiales bacterium]|nr:hypothetical protein [Chlamydiales bacterium]